jgi:hypothetical protein
MCLYKIAVNCNTEWAKGYDIAIKICNQTRDGKMKKPERLNNFMYKNRSISICDPASKSLPFLVASRLSRTVKYVNSHLNKRS